MGPRREGDGRGRSWVRAVAGLGVAVLLVTALGGCSSDPDDAAPTSTAPDATTSGTTQGDLDRTCSGIAALLYRDVMARAADLGADADQPATTGLVPEQITKFLHDLAPETTGTAADDVATVIAGAEAFADEGTPFATDVRAAFDRLVVWAATDSPCPASKPVWACINPTSTIEASGGDGGGPAPSAEGAVAVGSADPVGELTLVADQPGVKAYAWVDDHRLVRDRATVIQDEGGWVQAKRTTCPTPGAAEGTTTTSG